MTQKGYFKNGAWIEFPQTDFTKKINDAIENIEWGSMNSFSDDITCEYASRAMTDDEIEAIDAKAEEERINTIWYQPQYEWRPNKQSHSIISKGEIIEYDNWLPTKISSDSYTNENQQNNTNSHTCVENTLPIDIDRSDITAILLLTLACLTCWLISRTW